MRKCQRKITKLHETIATKPGFTVYRSQAFPGMKDSFIKKKKKVNAIAHIPKLVGIHYSRCLPKNHGLWEGVSACVHYCLLIETYPQTNQIAQGVVFVISKFKCLPIRKKA